MKSNFNPTLTRFGGKSAAAPVFRAETKPDFRYTSLQGAVPKW